jgi:hypothetical protein
MLCPRRDYFLADGFGICENPQPYHPHVGTDIVPLAGISHPLRVFEVELEVIFYLNVIHVTHQTTIYKE